ncbi:MAG: hypothetical protein JSW05_06650 [Candidatus Thorarchaeota archaeon]|nr:MAG: hypothetical protein JSW05_06650 [Candidatus Thorarchaeota archaeon]
MQAESETGIELALPLLGFIIQIGSHLRTGWYSACNRQLSEARVLILLIKEKQGDIE